MSWFTIPENRRHGEITVEEPEDTSWGARFSTLARMVLPKVLERAHPTVQHARHIVNFSPSDHDPFNTRARKEEFQGVRITGTVTSLRYDVRTGKITTPVITTISRRGIWRRNERVPDVPEELISVQAALHEIEEQNFTSQLPSGLPRHASSAPATLDGTYLQREHEQIADLRAFADLQRFAPSVYTAAITRLYLDFDHLPITRPVIDRVYAEGQLVEQIRESSTARAERADKLFGNDANVTIPAETMVFLLPQQVIAETIMPLDVLVKHSSRGSVIGEVPIRNQRLGFPANQVQEK